MDTAQGFGKSIAAVSLNGVTDRRTDMDTNLHFHSSSPLTTMTFTWSYTPPRRIRDKAYKWPTARTVLEHLPIQFSNPARIASQHHRLLRQIWSFQANQETEESDD